MEDLSIMTKLLCAIFLVVLNVIVLILISGVKSLTLNKKFHCQHCGKECDYKLSYFNLLMPRSLIKIKCSECGCSFFMSRKETDLLHRQKSKVFAWTFVMFVLLIKLLFEEKSAIYELIIIHCEGYVAGLIFLLMFLLLVTFMCGTVIYNYYSAFYNIIKYIDEQGQVCINEDKGAHELK